MVETKAGIPIFPPVKYALFWTNRVVCTNNQGPLLSPTIYSSLNEYVTII